MGRSRRLFRGDGDLQIVEPLQQSGDRDAALQSRQVMAEAIVVARSEGQMLVRCAGEVQCVGVGENRLLLIGGDQWPLGADVVGCYRQMTIFVGFSSLMSNYHSKCPLDVQLEILNKSAGRPARRTL